MDHRGQSDEPTDDLQDYLMDILSAAKKPLGKSPPKWLTKINEALGDGAYLQYSISQLADESGCHPVYLARLFRSCFGVSISDYVVHQRVSRSLYLMQAGAQSLTQIALETGYYDQSHMHRVFKRLTGLAPRNYIKRTH